jgi:hypothetical protein
MTTSATPDTPPPSETATSAPAAPGRNAAAPQFSADGAWWWTGQQWVPAPPNKPEKAAFTARNVVMIAITMLLLLGGYALIQDQGNDADVRQQNDENACVKFGACN